jgi:hypothetical protein
MSVTYNIYSEDNIEDVGDWPRCCCSSRGWLAVDGRRQTEGARLAIATRSWWQLPIDEIHLRPSSLGSPMDGLHHCPPMAPLGTMTVAPSRAISSPMPLCSTPALLSCQATSSRTQPRKPPPLQHLYSLPNHLLYRAPMLRPCPVISAPPSLLPRHRPLDRLDPKLVVQAVDAPPSMLPP